MQGYVWILQATIAEYIVTRPIFEMCTGAEQIPGTSRILSWWNQYHIQEEGGSGVNEGAEGEV